MYSIFLVALFALVPVQSDHPIYQPQFFQGRMLPHRMIDNILHQRVIFSSTVALENVHAGNSGSSFA